MFIYANNIYTKKNEQVSVQAEKWRRKMEKTYVETEEEWVWHNHYGMVRIKCESLHLAKGKVFAVI